MFLVATRQQKNVTELGECKTVDLADTKSANSTDYFLLFCIYPACSAR